MKQTFTIGTLSLFCFLITIFGFKLKSDFGQGSPAIVKNTNKDIHFKSTENMTNVYPNPVSGILNLHCDAALKSPITIKAINAKDMVVKLITSLSSEGMDNFRYVQLNTAGLMKGEYKILMMDVAGRSFSRYIYINK